MPDRPSFQRRLTTDIYPASYDWVKDEWIRFKETKGENYEQIMGDRRAYHARGYTGQAAKVDCWHNALSYDEETHFRISPQFRLCLVLVYQSITKKNNPQTQIRSRINAAELATCSSTRLCRISEPSKPICCNSAR